MLNDVPFPFTEKELYEKSIRIPIGKDWNSMDSYQKMITPKVAVRRGAMIDPIEEMKGKDEGEPEKRVGEKQREKNQKKQAQKRRKTSGKST